MARYKAGDILKLNHYPPLPDGKKNDEHPVVIISSDDANSREGFYTGVMISSTSFKDRFSFPLESGSTNYPMKQGSQARLYIVISFRESDVKSKLNELTALTLKQLRKRFIETVLS